MRAMWVVGAVAVLAGCATVRQEDLDAWKGVSVEELDTHTLFLTVPMTRTFTSQGIEVRNYTNGKAAAACVTNGSSKSAGAKTSGTAFSTCTSQDVVCNNLFYIQGGKVIEYAPVGQCFTDERVRPQFRRPGQG